MEDDWGQDSKGSKGFVGQLSEDAARSKLRVPIYCINLARSAGRRRAMEAEAARLGRDITFVEAVDGRQIDPRTVPEYQNDERAKQGLEPLIANEIACALSHKRALEAFLASGAAVGLIIEDDVVFEPDFERVVQAIIDETRAWDIVKLTRTKVKKSASLPALTLSSSHKLVAPLSTTQGAVANLYSRAGAKKALSSLQTFWEAVDSRLGRCWHSNIKMLEVRPYVVRHVGVDSTIDENNDRLPGWSPTNIRQRVRRRLFKITHSVLNPMFAARAAAVAVLARRRVAPG